MVGGFSDATPPTPTSAAAPIPTIQVLVSGEGVSGRDTVGLNEDLRLLVNAFVRAKHFGGGEVSPARPDGGAHSNIEVAVHGLNLAPHEASELHHRIRQLVQERIKDTGVRE
jgi:hypothetical protein